MVKFLREARSSLYGRNRLALVYVVNNLRSERLRALSRRRMLDLLRVRDDDRVILAAILRYHHVWIKVGRVRIRLGQL